MIDASEYWPFLDLPILRDMRKDVPVYIRFGDYENRSINWATGDYERGVSVYPGKIVDGVVYPDGDYWEDEIEYYCRPGNALADRRVWILTGKLAGEGNDGEPVIQSPVARKLPVCVGLRGTLR